MPDKTETISFRVTKQKRNEINDWAEQHGFTEADAVRAMIDRVLYDQQRLDEIKADEELREVLVQIEQQIEELDRKWWERLFF